MARLRFAGWQNRTALPPRRGVMRKCALSGFPPFTLAGVSLRQSSGLPNRKASYAGGSFTLALPLALGGSWA